MNSQDNLQHSTQRYPALNWTSDFEIGYPTLDSQHRQLFDLYGDVCSALEHDSDDATVYRAIERLIGYTELHFHIEEQLMKNVGYENSAEHLQKHRALLHDVKHFAEQLQQGHAVLVSELLAFLREWLISHILDDDMQLKHCLSAWE